MLYYIYYIYKAFGLLFKKRTPVQQSWIFPNKNETRLLDWKTKYYVCLIKQGLGRNKCREAPEVLLKHLFDIQS